MMNTKIVVILLILAVVLWRLAVMSNRASRVSRHDSGSGIVANCVALAILLRVDWENRQLMRGAKL